MAEPLELKVVLAAVDKMTAPARAALGANQQLADALAATRRRMAELDQAGKDFQAYTKLKDQLGELAPKMEEAQAKAQALAMKIKQPEKSDAYIKLKNQLGELTPKMETAREKLNSLAIKIKGAETPSARLTAQFQKAGDAVTRLEARQVKLAIKLKEAETPSARLTAQFKKAREAVNKLDAEHLQLTRRLDQTRAKVTAAGIPMRSLTEAQRALRQQTAAASDALSNQARQLGSVIDKEKQLANIQKQQQAALRTRDQLMQRASNMTMTGAGTLYTGKSIVQNTLAPVAGEAIKDEAAFAGVKKVVDFAKVGDAEAFRRELQKMTFVMPTAATGLYEIAAAGGQLGVAQKDLKEFTRTTSVMATAFDMTADRAGDSAAKISNVYQLPITQMSSVGDAVNHLSNNTAAKANEMLDVLARVGGTSKQFGLTAIQTAALADSMLALGKPPEVAATGINALLLKMQTATIQAKPFQKGLDDIGMSAEELEAKVRKNGQAALTDFLKTLEKLPDSKRMNVIGQLFGAEYADDISALVGGLQNYEKALNLVGKASNYAGSMQKEFEAKTATTEAQMQMSTNQLTALKTELGYGLLPMINELLAEIRPLIESTMKWARANPELVKTIMLTIVAVGGLVAVGGGLTMMLASLIGPVAMIRYGMAMFGIQAASGIGIIGRLGSVLGVLGRGVKLVTFALTLLGRAALLNPIGLTITVIAAGAYLIYRNWDDLVKWWNKTTFAKKVLDVLGFINPLKWVWELVKRLAAWWLGWTPKQVEAKVISASIKLAQRAAEKFAKWWNNLSLKTLTTQVQQVTKQAVSAPFRLGEKAGKYLSNAFGGGRAAGGTVAPGHFYQVNEMGPELLQLANKTFLMMGGDAGRVIPLSPAANDAGTTPKRSGNVIPLPVSRNASNSTVNQNISITINPAAGMSEREIAEEVARKLRDMQRQAEARARGRLHD